MGTTTTASDSPAENEPVGNLELDPNGAKFNLFMATNRKEGAQDLIVAISSDDYYGGFWHYARYWQDRKIQLHFVDVEDPSQMSIKDTLSIDGTLISSRRIGETLYLVSKYSPSIPELPFSINDHSVTTENAARLETIKLADLLPKFIDGAGTQKALINSQDCYLSPVSEYQTPESSVVTITAIPLADPTQFTSKCIVGNSEAIYMSPKSLYLATSSNSYLFDPISSRYRYDHRTLLHKFSINTAKIDYKGSGSVLGSLGGEQNKKSFRMGENGDYLRVVTSIGNSWGGDQSTRLAILKEDTTKKRLDEISRIDNLGKPGESLYASRFFGDTAYLVTFRTTDPLYILDLADPYHPSIAGELEINGYSDYLFPIAEGYLLGIGKDAIVDPSSNDFRGRGAWYQGIKLSLFNVTTPSAPTELNSIVIGKRGTSSAVLYDHHAFTMHASNNGQPTKITIPISLNDTEPEYSWGGIDQPSTHYNWTSTGLYGFEIDFNGTPKIHAAGSLIVEDHTTGGSNPQYADRSIILDNSIHYFRGDQAHSIEWQDFDL